MAKKQVIWSIRAQQDRLAFFEYWINRNGSKVYAKKLSKLFTDATVQIAAYPKIGKSTIRSDIRIAVIKDYLMLYKVNPNQIEILTLFDSRQNPTKLDKQLKKM